MSSDNSLTNSSEAELGKLCNNLEQVRHKLLDQYMSEDLEKYQEQARLNHEEQIQKGKESIQQLNENLQSLLNQAEVNKRIAEERKEELKKMKISIETSMKEMQETLLQKESTEGQLKIMTKEIEKEQELLVAQEKATHLRLQELRKATMFYKDRLAFSFKKIDGDHLQIVFTQINPNNTDQPYFFVVKVNSDKKYEVTDCQPAISNLDELICKLNETNNFSQFVITVRKAFKSMI
ncbi:kinetochore protein Spc25-like [Anneissia japonica]|uniref:kinetochore protein Spc25-like n=1 Tax=Anneissia japonica TaxID=1529436 RepID=UPI001425BB90|nr:kinetochore protein Spc25-like [Anneissia japonica]